MEIRCPQCVIRPWREGDERSLQRNADNYNVARNLIDRFPHPYTVEDARWWIENVQLVNDIRLAIEIDGEAVGGIGCTAKRDIYRFTGTIGYWLGEDYWGRGIVTEAVGAFVPRVFETTDFVRLEAGVFDHNRPSARVLEKNGFSLESRQSMAAYKHGRFFDVLLYVKLRDQSPPEIA